MSRIGKKGIIIPETIKANIENSVVFIEGPKGKLSYQLSNFIQIKKIDNTLQLHNLHHNKKSQSLYGLSRTLISNMIIGVSQGFHKQLEIQGVGYRGQIEGKNLILNVGYSHPVIIIPPEGIEISIENNTQITISGINKQIVGLTAAKIRKIRPPEPYKGKGIRYLNEKIRRKVGKAGK